MTPASIAPLSSWLAVVAAVERLLGGEGRVVLGIAGAPGAGKSTLAEAVVAHATGRGHRAAWVPMDGFHLADAELDRLGRRDRKGAADTFDAHGYRALLARIHAETSGVVYAPAFDRRLEQPIAGAIPVSPQARLVVTEGNYLLDAEPPWSEVGALLTEVWYCDVDETERRRRLVERHERFGKSPAAARDWERTVDQLNARRVAAARRRADQVVDLTSLDLRGI